jgi:membrane-bound lytic murein transglycosylase A
MPLSLHRLRLGVAALLGCGLLAGCAPKVPPVSDVERAQFVAVDWSALPGWDEDALVPALPALSVSCAALRKKSPEAQLGPAGGQVAAWLPFCDQIAALPATADPAALRAVLTQSLRPWRVEGSTGASGLFTGYYEPQLTGSLERTPRYTVPLYGVPDDLVIADLGQFHDDLRGRSITGRVKDGRLQRYGSRADITTQGLADHAPVLAWVDDAVAAFFLHIQGSGRISLPDGSELRVGYAAQNGHRYVAIGKPLIDRGALSSATVSMQSIRDWLHAHPDEAQAVMDLNPSYIFFTRLDGPGPLGAQGVPLTPGRSLAIDRRMLPLGAPMWLDAADPLDPTTRLRRLMVAQDTGGAIKGAVRGDVFWGHGAEAEAHAGPMKSPGSFWLLLPHGVTPAPAEAS